MVAVETRNGEKVFGISIRMFAHRRKAMVDSRRISNRQIIRITDFQKDEKKIHFCDRTIVSMCASVRACVTSHDDDVLKVCSQPELLTN